MYKCVHNFQSILCRLVDRGALKLYSGKSPNRILTGTHHIPTEFECGFSHLQHKADGILPELGDEHFLPNVLISVVNKSSWRLTVYRLSY